jgi:hypothetical protein
LATLETPSSLLPQIGHLPLAETGLRVESLGAVHSRPPFHGASSGSRASILTIISCQSSLPASTASAAGPPQPRGTQSRSQCPLNRHPPECSTLSAGHAHTPHITHSGEADNTIARSPHVARASQRPPASLIELSSRDSCQSAGIPQPADHLPQGLRSEPQFTAPSINSFSNEFQRRRIPESSKSNPRNMRCNTPHSIDNPRDFSAIEIRPFAVS